MLSPNSTDHEILVVLREAMLEVLNDRTARRRVEGLSAETPLYMLGIDSVTALEIAASIEDRAGIILTEEKMAVSRQVADLIAAVREGVRAANSA